MPDQPTQEQTEAIANALTGGRKIEAIKIYRAATGKGLKDAKDFVDALIPKLVEQDPEKYKALASSQGAGCASALIACTGLGAAAVLLAKAIA
jgi:ribosomal protein L7/L12